MRKIILINVEWNGWNGFIFEFIGLETNHFEGELFSVYASKDHFQFSVLFIRFDVTSPI